MRQPPASLGVTLERVVGADLASCRAEWQALERSTGGAPGYGVTHDWLRAWARAYRPRALGLVRIRDGARLVALGLLELRAPGRWRFAGAPVTAERGLLCAPGDEDAAWAALGGWLRRHARMWATLEGGGVSAGAGVLPGARLEGAPVPGLDLPETFEAYLAARGSSTRKALRQKLRRLEHSGGAVRGVSPDARVRALEDFLALHAARTESKNERHPQMDGRLRDLLAGIDESGTLRLRLLELVLDGATAGVTVRLDHGSTAFFFNAGMDPDAARLSPGINLELASIRDAIERGLSRFDLGPGMYRYKRDLGGVARTRYGLTAVSPALHGRLTDGLDRAAAQLRDGLRPIRHRARGVRRAISER